MPKIDISYIFSSVSRIQVANSSREAFVDMELLRVAIAKANQIMIDIGSYEVNISEILGMRNLSAFVGEVFARALASQSDGLLVSNPHQDGYPDLLLMDDLGLAEFERLRNNLRDKLPFSPFAPGGIEVKATCGSVPTPARLALRGLSKPGIGEQRIDYLDSYDWKAHHRDTNNLLGILWDFIEGTPVIVAVFYSSELSDEDWGVIVSPKKGGGRTTSVSIMNRRGLQKMYQGCLCVIDDQRYIDYINRKNHATKLSAAGF